MVRDDFFAEQDGGYAKFGAKKTFNQVWNKVLKFEAATGLSLDDGLTREQYVSLFNSMKIRQTMVFANCKTAVTAYVRYLVARGVLPQAQADVLRSVRARDIGIDEADGNGVRYFKNLNTLHKYIAASIDEYGAFDNTAWAPASCILYLAWYGLSDRQIADYPRSGVSDDGIIIGGEKVVPPADVLDELIRMRDAEGYFQQARNMLFWKFFPSEYLIRTARSGHCDPCRLCSLTSRLNRVRDGEYSLRPGVARQSGIFYRAYMRECGSDAEQFDLEDPAFVSELFCEDFTGDPVRMRSRVKDYASYKKLFR